MVDYGYPSGARCSATDAQAGDVFKAGGVLFGLLSLCFGIYHVGHNSQFQMVGELHGPYLYFAGPRHA